MSATFPTKPEAGEAESRGSVYTTYDVILACQNTMPGTWSEADDMKLWSLRSKPESSAVYKFSITSLLVQYDHG